MLQLLRHLHQKLPRPCKGKKLGATPPWYVQLRSFILVHTFCMKVISHDNFGTLLENLVLCRCSCALVFHTDNGWGSYTGHSEWYSGGCSCVLSWCDSHKFSCLRQVSPKQILFFIFVVLMVLAFLILFFSSFGVIRWTIAEWRSEIGPHKSTWILPFDGILTKLELWPSITSVRG